MKSNFPIGALLLAFIQPVAHADTLVPQGISSDAKIEKALAEGKIVRDDAWKLKLMARFNPAQLPEAYKGDSSRNADSILTNLASEIPTLSPASQKSLIGYFIPPIYEGSKLLSPGSQAEKDSDSNALNIIDKSETPFPIPRQDWTFYETSDVKIWWDKSQPDDGKDAARIASIFKTVKTKLEALTGKAFISDAGTHQFKGPSGETFAWGDGGNGKLDIYVSNLSDALALTVPYPPTCSEVSSFIVIRKTLAHDSEEIEATLAHEYMHVLQNTYVRGRACKEYERVDEGTANWAIQYVFPKNNWEHRYDNFFLTAEYPLWDWSYDTWPFYLFMERTLGEKSIPDIFSNYALSSHMEAVNQALPGGFEKQWPFYPIREWNQTDVSDDFRTWDGLNWKPLYNIYHDKLEVNEVKPDAKGNYRYESEVHIKPLARQYFHFVFNNPSIRSVRFEATLGYEPTHKGRIKALVKYFNKAFVVEDWSQKTEDTEICRDVYDEKIEEIVLIFTNVD